MQPQIIKEIKPLVLPWETQDPFIFCSYHYDEYPGGNEKLGPIHSLDGRNIGQDFVSKDGWNMYHGESVPGFPVHPHCGFETVSIVTKGMVDHSDSLGGRGRFGNGDVQWVTTGSGLQHSEMFPLLREDENPFEIFQLWMNLPSRSKKVAPHYKMLWREDIPVVVQKDALGNSATVSVIAGNIEGTTALDPAPDSWAADPKNSVQIWTIKLDPHGVFTIPAFEDDVTRTLYFYDGTQLKVGGVKVQGKQLMHLQSAVDVTIENGSEEAFLFFLQGKPIGEPLVQHGPFVGNSPEDIQEALAKYRKNQFGGWPWKSREPVHDANKGRFAEFPSGEYIEK
ncbi:MAG: pirin family protein [Fibrobacterales bacterium]